MRFGGSEPRIFDVDPVPRIVEADEWDRLERGLAQRSRALNAFLEDVYAERRIVAAGLLRTELLERAEWYEPAMAGAGMPAVRAHVAGPDLVRGADGELRVLEDNLRAPSGLAYAAAAREAMAPVIEAAGMEPRSLDPGIDALGAMLRAAAPDGRADPLVVLLNDGPDASALFEHRALAGRVGMAIAMPAELRRRGNRLLLGDDAIDVIYRRVDDERLTGPDGSPTPLGELLIEPLRGRHARPASTRPGRASPTTRRSTPGRGDDSLLPRRGGAAQLGAGRLARRRPTRSRTRSRGSGSWSSSRAGSSAVSG